MNLKTTVCSIIAVLFLISCDSDTSGLGSSLTPAEDVIKVDTASCFAVSHTIKAVDSLMIMSSKCYLGQFTEQYSGTTINAGYLTQLNCMEDFTLTDSVYGIGDHVWPIDLGNQKPYYANLRIYYSYFFGDSTNSVKIDVFPLDKMIDTDTKYYPDIDPSLFCDINAQPLASINVSGWNLQDADSLRDLYNYIPSITIPLPDTIAKKILESYFDPATQHYFADARSFMENLCKGFYIRCSQGDGTIFYIDRTILEVNFKFIEYNDDDEPVLQSLMAEFPGNSEVLQLNSFKWKGLESELSDSSCTWIRTPFGVFTEITLPIDDMRDEEYVLNSALLCLSAAVTEPSRFKPSRPSTLLLIRKDLMQDFFSKNSTTDNTESYVANYSNKYGTYTFSNIAALVEKIYSDREEWMSRNNGTKADYEENVKNWNKVVLIPVTATTDSNKSFTSYKLDIGMHQLKLIGGNTPIKIKTIRSKF